MSPVVDDSSCSLRPLRHRCAECGGSCQSVFVSIDDPSEHTRLERYARLLGLSAPVEAGHLRLVDARCLFQDDGGACRLHAAFGPEAKPEACRQYPRLSLDTEHGPRVGIDPCCFHAHDQRADAPQLEPSLLPARRVLFGPSSSAREGRLLEALAQPGASVCGMLHWLQSGTVGPSERLPIGLGPSWVRCLQAAGLPRFVHARIAGPVLRAALGGTFASIATLSARQAPAWPPLEPRLEADVVAAVEALVFLRVCSSAIPRPDVVAGLALLGAALLAWVEPRPEAVGFGLAGWFRLMRAPQFSRALLVSETLPWERGAS